MAPSVPSSCTECALCCTSQSEQHVPVTGDDWSRLGDLAESLTQWLGNRVFMRMHEGHCNALKKQVDGAFACSVYATRPEVCRELEHASSACIAEIVIKASDGHRRLPLW